MLESNRLYDSKWLSWWDMLKNYCSEFVRLAGVLETITQCRLQAYTGRNESSIHKEFVAVRRILEQLADLLEGVEMPVSRRLVQEARYILLTFWPSDDKLPTEAQVSQVQKVLNCLPGGIKAELQSRLFYFVPDHLARFYNERQMDEAVVEEFPSAIRDIEEAGKCLALGRDTACAFHLMRVIEHGINKIQVEYSLPELKSWGQFLNHLRGHAKKHPDEEKAIMTIHARIEGIKSAWRDDTMHVVRSYNQEEALEVLQAARAFMNQIVGPLP